MEAVKYLDKLKAVDDLFKAKGVEISEPEFRLLHEMTKKPNGRIKDLSNLRSVATQSVSRMCGHLSARGLISVAVNAKDKRERFVALTPLGAKIERQYRKKIEDIVND